MSERYKRLYALPGELYITGAPVIIAAGALLLDQQNGAVLAQLKLRNIGAKPIVAVKVRLTPCDLLGKPIGEPVEDQYLDLDAARDTEFGSRTAVFFDDPGTCSFQAAVSSVIFADHTVWEAQAGTWVQLLKPWTLEDVLQEEELVRQYRLQYGGNSRVMPQRTWDLWFCTCGALNGEAEPICHCCGAGRDALLSFDRESLRRDCDARLAEADRLEQQRKEEASVRAKKNKKFAAVAAVLFVVLAAAGVLFFKIIPTQNQYQQAVALMESGDYQTAMLRFGEIAGWRDARERALALWDSAAVRPTIAGGAFHTVGIKADGTATAAGSNAEGQMNVSGWTDLVAIAAGEEYTVGLRSDGTAVAVGHDYYGECKLSDWEDIAAIAVGDYHTVGLKLDGTVVAAGYNGHGECEVSDWTDIVAVAAGTWSTVGLRSDGTVVENGNYLEVSKWKNITAIAAGGLHAVGLKSDGTAVALTWASDDYGMCNVSGWSDLTAVAAGNYHTVGLQSDGTVVAVGSNEYGQCEVSEWTDIVAIAAGEYHTIGLKSDGTVVVAGNGQNGQYDVENWTDIRIP